MIVIDATDAIIGRLGTYVAKKVIENESVVIVNAEKAVFSGTAEYVTGIYFRRRQMTDKANPDHGAKWPRRPDILLKRIIRGMLPKRNTRMKAALGNLRIYMGKPVDIKETAEPFRDLGKDRARTCVSLEVVCERLGWKAPKAA
ncbi:50S ribosomal protein L13 [Candidatus Micrarchaeota archaeon]|nr:50S ribosomal protein L13 [Candidatus Micrarchaeota archaeon]